ncbi:hypothetical protein TVAG_104540 [Trichomonas vaginalis G3]|uniref:Uncharacterized protein n=1 Tax=Trichomonas vaginalis (strain ATCC PRA-98 / G3) TaxID=412133 RepID=A2F6A2_TRIV3|nr:hypothetical protein TVAGG3_1003470 [Trichomonas vaginalis G3]EAX99573.1 hypothetical protein TVAG_104540 [Trichomonas vaginalis G3]KAI5490959.1 hypothetical protein TVAGG3_1003470 [Trichomonas vaginalis G3]|eukprot:XP_001312503.1 hypothetical protein [Trichomonas vaginalis G3]
MATFEESIQIIEKGLQYLKKQHKMYTDSQIEPSQYEINCEDCLSKIDDSLICVRHTYLPMSIPKLLKFPENPPAWLNLKKKEIEEYQASVKNSEMLQERLLRKFRRPGLRKSNVEKAVQLLTIEQQKLYNAELWKIYVNLAESLKVSSRINIPIASKAPQEVIEGISEAVEQADINIQTIDDISMVLTFAFGEDGFLEKGLNGGLKKDTAVITAAATQVFPNFDKGELLGVILPYVAKIYENEVIEDAKTIAPKFIEQFEEASSILGDNISISDFAQEGELPEKITNAILDVLFYDDFDQLIAKFNDAAKEVIKISKSYRQARAILGTGLIKAQDPRIVPLFFAGMRYCSPGTLSQFNLAPLYLMTFEEITTLVPDFE